VSLVLSAKRTPHQPPAEGDEARLNRIPPLAMTMVWLFSWPASTSSPGRSMRWPRIDIAAANSSKFLELFDTAYPAHTAIKPILDNHSAHISKETTAWLAGQPRTASNLLSLPMLREPQHGSWLNLVEGFFSKLTRPLGPAPHPRRIQAGAQRSPHGRRGAFQRRAGRSHMDLQARQGRVI
jgi:hypothetical protein